MSNTKDKSYWFKHENYDWIQSASDELIAKQCVVRFHLLSAAKSYVNYIKYPELKKIAETHEYFMGLRVEIEKLKQGETKLVDIIGEIKRKLDYSESDAIKVSTISRLDKNLIREQIEDSFPTGQLIIGTGLPMEKAVYDIRSESKSSIFEPDSLFPVEINLSCTNQQIISELTQMLDSWRETIREKYSIEYSPMMLKPNTLIKKIKDYRVIQLMDFELEKIFRNDIRVTDENILDNLYSDFYEESFARLRNAKTLINKIKTAQSHFEHLFNT